MMKNIVLIGFMGSGKTTIGKVLEEKINLPFADTDKLIEIEEKCKQFNVNMIVGGPPCQGFSNKGKKLGLDDERNFLFLEYITKFVSDVFISFSFISSVL